VWKHEAISADSAIMRAVSEGPGSDCAPYGDGFLRGSNSRGHFLMTTSLDD
jgi:hypothetical protein